MASTRRHFLKGAGAGAVCTAALPACGPSQQAIDAGNAADLAEGVVSKLEGSDILLGRDANGIYAMSSICPHFGCNLNDEGGLISATDITCGAPCGHGSQFTLDGEVQRGPASSPLQHWRVAVDDDGNITVDVGTEVDAAERAPIT